MPEKFGVESIEAGNRAVDRIKLSSEDDVANLLKDYTFLASGGSAIVFKHNKLEVVLRIEIVNPLGKVWTKNWLKDLISKNGQQEEVKDKLLYALIKIDSTPDMFYGLAQENTQEKLLRRIAAHNAQYVRDPSTTIPINTVYELNDQVFALRMRYLEGTPAVHSHSMYELAKDLTQDHYPGNILTEITNSFQKDQIIDISNFIPFTPKDENK